MCAGPDTPPQPGATAFHCPNCGAFAHQGWFNMHAIGGPRNQNFQMEGAQVTQCFRCQKWCLWKDSKPIHPRFTPIESPSNDLPIDIRQDFEEARLIATESPRGAAALLRLAIQKLCRELGLK
jgi:hypothetical protein